MSFKLIILGSNSAIPAYGRHPTAQILNHNHRQYLIDCGEGTQIQFQKFSIKRAKLDHAFISHLHGDHYFGLIGLITSFSLNGRQKPFHIFGPSGLEEIISVQLKYGYTQLSYELVFHPLEDLVPGLIFENAYLSVHGIELHHRIDCTGFIFREKDKDLNILPEKISQYQISIPEILEVKKGAALVRGGEAIPNEELTRKPVPGRSYVFITDTLYKEEIIPEITGVDLLYHEATFDHSLLERAEKTHHTTAVQAAELAKKAGVRKLVIGHFSSRYESLDDLLAEAKNIFPNTELAVEGAVFDV